MENEGEWMSGAENYEKNGHQGYVAMVRWARGKCFRNTTELAMAYANRTLNLGS